MRRINIDNIIDEKIINNFVKEVFVYISKGKRILEAKQFYNVLKLNYDDDEIKKKLKDMIAEGKTDDDILDILKLKFKENTYKGISDESEKIKKAFKKLGEKLYERFRDNHGVDFLNLFKKNNILVCPYCNINKFELLLDKKLKTLIPSLDHIENKADNGLGSYVNIKNLIPSCNTCNSSFKGAKKLTEECNLYFMEEDIINKFKFVTILNCPLNSGIDIEKIDIEYDENTNDEVKIYLNGDENINNNQEFSFYIKQRIQNYKYEAKNFIWESKLVHNNLFKKRVLDELSNNDYLFYDDKLDRIKNIHEIPLSKLYLDIYEQYFN